MIPAQSEVPDLGRLPSLQTAPTLCIAQPSIIGSGFSRYGRKYATCARHSAAFIPVVRLVTASCRSQSAYSAAIWPKLTHHRQASSRISSSGGVLRTAAGSARNTVSVITSPGVTSTLPVTTSSTNPAFGKFRFRVRNTEPGPGRLSATSALRIPVVTPPWTIRPPNTVDRARCSS